MVRLGGDTPESKPDAELRDALHAMEAKVRKLREVRNQHNDNARRAADQRNQCQAQYKEHKEKVDLVLSEVKAIMAMVKTTTGWVHPTPIFIYRAPRSA